MNELRFSPELFEHRSEALEVLAERGFELLADFATVDVLHDLYGIEVCGIPEEETARRILGVLRAQFAAWSHRSLVLKDWGSRDRGWRVRVHRDRSQGRRPETWAPDAN
jgi:hypothetical protein